MSAAPSTPPGQPVMPKQRPKGSGIQDRAPAGSGARTGDQSAIALDQMSYPRNLLLKMRHKCH
eukprot:7522149-Karenia_brevis.AAC.1